MATRGIVNRDLSDRESFGGPLNRGAVVYQCRGVTYGVISGNGIAILIEPDETPFFEVPADAVDWEN